MATKEDKKDAPVRISTKHQVTIPKDVFEQLGLQVGEYLEGYCEDGKIVFIRQKIVDRDQAYFWTPEWQEGEREASKDIAEGRVEVFDNVDDWAAAMEANKPNKE